MGTEFRAKTGLPLAPLISAGKWTWLLENDESIASLAGEGKLRFGTVDSWLLHQFTRGAVHATDFSNASRTGLLNLNSQKWDTELLKVFGIPLDVLPGLHSSSGFFGSCSAIPCLEGVPILAAVGDSHAAMFGHGNYSAGSVKATYGTGSSLMALTASLPADTPMLARTIAWSIGGSSQFALEGNIAMAGSAVQWVGEFLDLKDPATAVAVLAETVTGAEGVYFVPAMVGLGAPYWDAEVRGTVTGLGRSHTSAHLARASVDAIAYQVADVFFAIEKEAGVIGHELNADGGATRNAALMQFQADILGRPVRRSANEELSALGAAWLAGLSLGWWNSLSDIESLPHDSEKFTPAMDREERDRLYRGWVNAVRRARLGVEAEA
jgi:glycerol kinase